MVDVLVKKVLLPTFTNKRQECFQIGFYDFGISLFLFLFSLFLNILYFILLSLSRFGSWALPLFFFLFLSLFRFICLFIHFRVWSSIKIITKLSFRDLNNYLNQKIKNFRAFILAKPVNKFFKNLINFLMRIKMKTSNKNLYKIFNNFLTIWSMPNRIKIFFKCNHIKLSIFGFGFIRFCFKNLCF